MKEVLIRDKSFNFSVRIINLYKFLKDRHNEFVLSKQLLRCGTSIGANISESQDAQSTADFIHKMSIALKEARETEYWLKLLKETGFIELKEFNSIYIDCEEIIRILVAIIKTSKKI